MWQFNQQNKVAVLIAEKQCRKIRQTSIFHCMVAIFPKENRTKLFSWNGHKKRLRCKNGWIPVWACQLKELIDCTSNPKIHMK